MKNPVMFFMVMAIIATGLAGICTSLAALFHHPPTADAVITLPAPPKTSATEQPFLPGIPPTEITPLKNLGPTGTNTAEPPNKGSPT